MLFVGRLRKRCVQELGVEVYHLGNHLFLYRASLLNPSIFLGRIQIE